MTTMLNTKVIVRSSQSGCWFGELSAREGDTVTLINARRLWRWWAARGVSLSGVASHGLHPAHLSECKITPVVRTAVILGCCEVLSATPEAALSVEAAPDD